MKIIKLESENIKKIKAVEITPDGAIVRITGKNANGKTSVLDSILYALGGDRAIPSTPIRKGASKAHIALDLGEMVVERNITKKGSYLKVTAKDGKSIGSPQRMLDSLVGRLSFDPLSFSRESPKKQADILRELAGLDVSDLNEREARMMEERRDATAEGKALAARLDAMPKPSKELPDQHVDIKAIQDQLTDATEHNNKRADAEKVVLAIEHDLVYASNEIKRLDEELIAASKKMKALEVEKSNAESAFAKFGLPINTNELMDKIQSAMNTNRAIAEAEAYSKISTQIDKARADLRKRNKEIDSLRNERAQRIAQADYPLPELAISDESEVFYNGLPISQASLAEQLKISTAVAMSLNPNLRVIRITDGSLLDSESMAVIEGLAKHNDYQVWIEQVDETGEVGFYIEDGSLIAINGEAVEK